MADGTAPATEELRCPSCGSDELRQVDQGVRFCHVDAVDPGIKVVYFSEGDSGYWEHERIACADCDATVELPDGWTWDVLY